MKIESIIRRKNGTTVTFNDGTTYKFQPKVEGGPHTAEVTNQEHIDRFLSLPEGFRRADGAEPESKKQEVAPTGDGEQSERGSEQADSANSETAGETAAPLGRDALVAEYVARFGRKPHHKKSAEAIKAELAE